MLLSFAALQFAACAVLGNSAAHAQSPNEPDVKIIRRPKITLQQNVPAPEPATVPLTTPVTASPKLKPLQNAQAKPHKLRAPERRIPERRIPGELSPFVMPVAVALDSERDKTPSNVRQALGQGDVDGGVQQAGGTEAASQATQHWIRPKRNVGRSGQAIAGSKPSAPKTAIAPASQPVSPAILTAPDPGNATLQTQSRSITQQGARLSPIRSPEIQLAPPRIHVQRRKVSAGLPKVRVTKPQFAPAPAPKKKPVPSTSSASTHSIFITDQPQTQFARANSQVVRGGISTVAGETELIQANPSQATTSQAPPSPSVVVPVPAVQAPSGDVQIADENGLMSLRATNIQMVDVLRLIADYHNLNLVLGPNVTGPVTISIRAAELNEILDAILGVAGFSWHQVGNLLYVTASRNESTDPRVQGRTVRVYPLNYVSAVEVEKVVTALLSSVGSVFVSQASDNDQLKTREIIIVEDNETAHFRIAEYIAQIDVPPKQVLVEAHVLQIALDDEDRHGINLQSIARLDGSRISVTGTSFADDPATGPSLALRVDGTDMDSVLELIRTNTNARTLASPKVSVVNHQAARIQIGQRLPFSVATTTQTSTIQNVQFLEVGIVMTVQPIITEDGNVLMTISPKVSGGRITESGFPEEDTTELETTILLPDGGGVVIGGLIREEDTETRAFVPGIGRVPILGHLFSRKTSEVRRDELVIALVTHVMPDVYSVRSHEMQELQNTLPPHALRDLKHPALPSSHHGGFHGGPGGQNIIHHGSQPTIHHGSRNQKPTVKVQNASTRRSTIKRANASTKRAASSAQRR